MFGLHLVVVASRCSNADFFPRAPRLPPLWPAAASSRSRAVAAAPVHRFVLGPTAQALNAPLGPFMSFTFRSGMDSPLRHTGLHPQPTSQTRASSSSSLNLP